MNSNSNNNMMKSNQHHFDSLVLDYFCASVETILKERHCVMSPIPNEYSPEYGSYADNIDYCNQMIKKLSKSSFNHPIKLDVYVTHPYSKKSIMLESWVLRYQKQMDMKDNRQYAFVTRRIVTLLRTLHCFVRTLPGFNFLLLSKRLPVLTFDLYNDTLSKENLWECEVCSYKFPPISTTKGLVHTSVVFMSPKELKNILDIDTSSVSIPTQSPNYNSMQFNSVKLHKCDNSPQVTKAIPIPIPIPKDKISSTSSASSSFQSEASSQSSSVSSKERELVSVSRRNSGTVITTG